MASTLSLADRLVGSPIEYQTLLHTPVGNGFASLRVQSPLSTLSQPQSQSWEIYHGSVVCARGYGSCYVITMMFLFQYSGISLFCYSTFSSIPPGLWLPLQYKLTEKIATDVTRWGYNSGLPQRFRSQQCVLVMMHKNGAPPMDLLSVPNFHFRWVLSFLFHARAITAILCRFVTQTMPIFFLFFMYGNFNDLSIVMALG